MSPKSSAQMWQTSVSCHRPLAKASLMAKPEVKKAGKYVTTIRKTAMGWDT